MDFEFHYYITGLIAHASGFSEEESEIIAYSSQFVDDNIITYDVKDKYTGEVYSNYISQTINILKPRKTLMRIYPIFHFVPGDPTAVSARRKDGKMHILNTTVDGEITRCLMDSAFRSPMSRRLYRIGIASHGYTDAWAHQNFIGLEDDVNSFSMNLMPDIGHANMFFRPDRINDKWVDNRIPKLEIDNNLRFIDAAENLFRLYNDYLGLNAHWTRVEDSLLQIMYCPKQQKRLQLYYEKTPWLPVYDDSKWFNDCVRREVVCFKDSSNFLLSKFIIFKDKYWWTKSKENADWFKFQEAIKEHQVVALIPISKIIEHMEILKGRF